jgi:hypothetical protein
MRAAPPPNAIALSGNPAMIAADPSDPTNPACFKNSRLCVKLVLIFSSLSPAKWGFLNDSWEERTTAGESIAISQNDHNWVYRQT